MCVTDLAEQLLQRALLVVQRLLSLRAIVALQQSRRTFQHALHAEDGYCCCDVVSAAAAAGVRRAGGESSQTSGGSAQGVGRLMPMSGWMAESHLSHRAMLHPLLLPHLPPPSARSHARG